MVLFCLVKDVYQRINPWPQRYEFLKLLSRLGGPRPFLVLPPLRKLWRFLELLRLAVVAYLVDDTENVKRYAAAETIDQAALELWARLGQASNHYR